MRQETITVLSKDELTVIIPEQTTIRKAETDEIIDINQLELLPHIDKPPLQNNHWEDPTPIPTPTSTVPISIVTKLEGEVSIENTEVVF